MLISSLINAESHCARVYTCTNDYYIYICITGNALQKTTRSRFDPSIWLPVFLSLSRDRPSIRAGKGEETTLSRDGEEELEGMEGTRAEFFSLSRSQLLRVTMIKRIVPENRWGRTGGAFLRPLSHFDPPTLECPRTRTREEKCAGPPSFVQRPVIRFIIER